MFRMKALSQLNGRQREEIRDLENICKKKDGIQGGISLSPEEEGESPIFYLGYEEDMLIGISILYTMPENEAEICGYIHPQYRTRPIYKKFLAAVKKEMERAKIAEGCVVHEPRNVDEFAAFVKEGYLRYMHSEYLMEWKYSYRLLPTNALTLRLLKEEERTQATELLCSAFPMERAKAEERIQDTLKEGGCVYGAWKQKEMVGIFCLSYGKDAVYVFDFAVQGDVQGRGVGKAMLKELIRLVQEGADPGKEPKKIRLQVGSKNEAGFRLYQKNGFQVISQRDYYRLT